MPRGRKKGSKDTKPRVRRTQEQIKAGIDLNRSAEIPPETAGKEITQNV